jgi:hypothetical protein
MAGVDHLGSERRVPLHLLPHQEERGADARSLETLEDGLRAVRLQASGAADEGRIRSWTDVVDLYAAADERRPVAR